MNRGVREEEEKGFYGIEVGGTDDGAAVACCYCELENWQPNIPSFSLDSFSVLFLSRKRAELLAGRFPVSRRLDLIVKGMDKAVLEYNKPKKYVSLTALKNWTAKDFQLQKMVRDVCIALFLLRLFVIVFNNVIQAVWDLLLAQDSQQVIKELVSIFALEHCGWILDDWKNVLFSDEISVSLFGPERLSMNVVRYGERYTQDWISPTYPF